MSRKQQPIVLPMNVLGWLGPAVLISLLVLALGLTVYPTQPLWPVTVALLVLLVLGTIGHRRRSQAQLVVDRTGLHARWAKQRLDLPWGSLQRVKGSTVWFDRSAVAGRPPQEVPPAVRRAVLAGSVPRIKLVTFTRSLATGPVGDAVRRHRPDLVPAAPVPEQQPRRSTS